MTRPGSRTALRRGGVDAAPSLEIAGPRPRGVDARSRRGDIRAEAPKRQLPPMPVLALLVGLALPWLIQIGSFKLTPYRIVLIVVILPCLIRLASGRAGRIRVADIALLMFSLWGMMGLAVVNSPQVALQTGGVLFLETMGGYLVARCYIRTAEDFFGFVRVLFWIVALLLPFALLEVITGHNVLLEILSTVFPTHPITDKEPRWGLRRVQGIFEHPILMGICCGSILAMTQMVLGRGRPLPRRWLSTIVVGFTAALSLSSGPISGMILQIMLMGWNWLMRRIEARWKLLIVGVSLGLLLVQLNAKRPLSSILFSAFAFEPQSAYFRNVIWEFGSLAAINHPWFGAGLNEWDRPSWMPASIDMFWLYNAVIYGIPPALLMLLAFFSVVLGVGRLKGLSDKLYDYRAAFLISMTSLFLTGWMVHYWNATYVLFLMLLGSGVWFMDAARTDAGEAEPRDLRRVRRRPPARDRSRPPKGRSRQPALVSELEER